DGREGPERLAQPGRLDQRHASNLTSWPCWSLLRTTAGAGRSGQLLLLGIVRPTVSPADLVTELVHRADRLPHHSGWLTVRERLVRGTATERRQHHVLGQRGGRGAEGAPHRLLELRVLHGGQGNRRRRQHRAAGCQCQAAQWRTW